MSGGRPTEYRPEYCEQVIEWGKLGKSKAWMAAHLEITRQTLDNWIGQYPEFLDAMTRARDLSQAWWEDIGQCYVMETKDGPKLNSGVYNKSMSARFPDDWRENTKVDQHISGSMEIKQITRRVVDPKKADGTGD